MTDRRKHLSEVQDLCTGDDVELVMGATYGLREWSIYSSTDLGLLSLGGFLPEDIRLVGHFGNEWDLTKPLQGTCQSEVAQVDVEIELDRAALVDAELIEFAIRKRVAEVTFDWSSVAPLLDPVRARAHLYLGRTIRPVDWMLDDPFSGSHRIQIPSDVLREVRGQEEATVLFRLTSPPLAHPVGHPLCTCGIYAYHDRRSLALRKPENSRGFVLGLVRAYGHVTTGTKGLRAEKAQTVAVTLPLQCALPDRAIAPMLAEWKAANIAIFPTPWDLFDFAERGGYLENPDDLQKEAEADG